MPTYLVTGATGFVGRHITEELRRRVPDARVLALVRESGPGRGRPPDSLPSGVDVIVGSPLDRDQWMNDPRLASLDGIFHLAAEVRHSRTGSDAMAHFNVAGTLEMVRVAAEKRCRLLFVSTSGTVGCSKDPESAPDEDAPYCEEVVRDWPYYLSKIRAEREARALAEELAVELIVFRLPVILGPGDHRFRSTGNVLRVLRRKLPFIIDGEMHFVDVRDAAAAMVRAMVLPSPRPVYHLTGSVSSLDDFFRMIAREAGVTPAWRKLPAKLIWYAAKLNEATGHRLHVVPDPVVIEMASHHWRISSRYAESDLAYKPRPAAETIADTVAWMRRHHPDLSAGAPSEPDFRA
ncbi:MAG: NAD-dependent epimerase/dehydratase family protein [Gemmatimonadales bacterium]